MAPAGAGLIDDSHGGVGPPPASTPTPAKATAAAAVNASERILPLMKTPSTCESDKPAPAPRLGSHPRCGRAWSRGRRGPGGPPERRDLGAAGPAGARGSPP